MIIGIDLGTTNSLVSIWENGSAHILPNALGKALTPSVVSLDKDTFIVGEPALKHMEIHPELGIMNFKRHMGSDKKFKLGRHVLRAEELSALILKRLKEDAEAYLGKPVTEAVISVPAYFSNAQRNATKVAGKLAGLHVERLINEPTAAGLAYGLQEQQDETNYLIVDLGGGTLDVSILTKFFGIVEVRASSGDNHLGGIDFTAKLKDMFIEKLKQSAEFKEKNLTAIIHQRIHEQAELAKLTLTIQPSASMKVKLNGTIHEHAFTNEDFEQASDSLLERLKTPIKKALADAKLSASQIEKVILAGGASRMMIVRKAITRLFGQLPLVYIDPDQVIVQGVAIQAGLKAQHQELDELVITDVAPYSLGIAVANQTSEQRHLVAHFDPIIERNTAIPVSKSRTYFPTHPEQRHIMLEIYQGESFYLDKNIKLGELKISIPLLKNPAIDVRFTYDINGILEVESTFLENNQKQRLIIDGNSGTLTEKQINDSLAALAELKIHPREVSENIILLSRAERLFEEAQGDTRAFLAEAIQQFHGILNKQDMHEIIRAQREFDAFLIKLQNEITTI